jgi:hypothetical protein
MSRGYQTTYVAISVFLVGLGSVAFAGHVIYVDASAIGASNGSSWTDAYNHLQDALIDANSMPKPVEIRVARGIYTPDQGAGVTPGDQMETFQLINGVTLKGGYAGSSQPDPDVRSTELYETVLSGDPQGNDGRDFVTTKDNSCFVVMASHTDQNAVLDGFTITGGNRSLPPPNDDSGAAMLIESGLPTVIGCTFRGSDCCIRNIAGSPTFTGCVFRDNPGSGVVNTDGGSPVIANCLFKDNSGNGVSSYGGGDLTVTNCTFESNDGGVGARESTATVTSCIFKSNGGCGVGIDDCQLTCTNCTFEQNGDGWTNHGAIYSFKSNLTLSDCTFIRNNGRGIFNSMGSNLMLTRCLFVGNIGYSTFSFTGDATLYDCTFRANRARYGGPGAIYAIGNLALHNCRFSGNSGNVDGGAIGAHGNLIAVGCVFSGNLCGSRGGAIMAGRAVLSNCTFTDNHDLSGRRANAIEPTGSSPSSMKFTHCIIWNGEESIGIRPATEHVVTVSYSNVEGGWPGEGNIDADPCFAEPGYWVDANDPNVTVEPNALNAVWIEGDYHLRSQTGRWDAQMQQWIQDDRTSPCIDAGDPGSPIGPEPFPNGGVINMGAYGGTIEASKSYFGEPICETIVAGDINGDCKVDCSDFAILASHWLLRGSDFINMPPTVTIVAPPNGAEFHYPTPIFIQADATDVDGSVVWLRFTMAYKSNGRSHSSSCSATETMGRWWYDWYWWGDTGIPFDGNYTITAKASDDDCAVSVSAPVVVTLHVP